MRMIISKEVLKKAVDRNLLHENQLEPLHRFLTEEAAQLDEKKNKAGSDTHEEPLRFIRSFGDVFISLGIVFVSVAMNMIGLSGLYYLLPVVGLVLLAEWLVRHRRLVLPGMVILLSILYFVNRSVEFNQHEASVFDLSMLGLTSLLFYARYRMPFSLFPLAVSLVAIIIIQIGFDVIQQPIYIAVPGLMVFAVALWLDAQDTRRVSHLSDSAFWLHLIAAPLIVHGVMVSMLISDNEWINVISPEAIILLFFFMFFLIALFIDRRAMLVSTQLYMIYALTQMFTGSNYSDENVLIYVLIVLGMFVIYFGSYWYKTRSLLFSILADTAVARYVPSLRSESN